jgi:dolichol kinase
VAAVIGYAGSVLLTLLLFPAHAELGLTVLAVLAFGDGSATLGGKLFGGKRLPWNRDTTWAGLICFVCVGLPMAALVYWGETYFNPETASEPVPISIALLCGGTATVIAALAESVPSRINDNIRVGLAASLAVVSVHALAVGL